MLGYRTWGLLAWIAAVACGGNTERARSDDAPTKPSGSSGSKPDATGTSGATTSNRAGSASTDPGQAGGGGMAGDDTTAAAGAASEDPCDGFIPVCQLGETVCEPTTGRLTTCTDCGQAALPALGDACVRVLASDKESNNFCVIKSSDQLECWPSWGETDKSVVPSDVVELLLPDDGASQRPIKPCLHDRADKYSCVGVEPGCKVATGDYGACVVCQGKLYCDQQITVPALVGQSFIDVSVTDSSAFLLGDVGVEAPGVPARLPDPSQGKPSKLLVDHQSAGCIVSDQGKLSCWVTLREPLRPAAWTGAYRKVVPSTMPRACALDQERQLRCGDIFEDTTPAPLGPGDVVDFAASSSMVCSLSVAGKVSCWRFREQIEPVEVPAGW